MPIAGCPSATAAPTTSPIRAAPSSIEYSVWTWRWVKLPRPVEPRPMRHDPPQPSLDPLVPGACGQPCARPVGTLWNESHRCNPSPPDHPVRLPRRPPDHEERGVSPGGEPFPDHANLARRRHPGHEPGAPGQAVEGEDPRREAHTALM